MSFKNMLKRSVPEQRVKKADPEPPTPDSPEYTRWDDTNDNTVIITPQCHACAHWHVGTLECDTFPDAPGIPDAILSNDVIHDSEYPGDHGILYRPKD